MIITQQPFDNKGKLMVEKCSIAENDDHVYNNLQITILWIILLKADRMWINHHHARGKPAVSDHIDMIWITTEINPL